MSTVRPPAGVPRQILLRLAWVGIWLAVAAWAVFWVSFVAAALYTEGLGGWRSALRLLAGLLVPVGVGAFHPRTGGVLMILFGLASGLYFADWAGRLLLSAPAILLGALLAFVPRLQRTPRGFPVQHVD